jgi:phosphohistidine swiveling domain-containing protein
MIIPLEQSGIPGTGGKAKGLALLMELGLAVPGGIVLVPGENGSWKEELSAYLAGTPFEAVAVRSSALAEDGEHASFAGQFQSYLDCRSEPEIIRAVEKCLDSANRDRVDAYRKHFHVQQAGAMPVIIQEMVRAECSGVIFTANPVAHRTDQWMISVVRGSGEKLMAGTAEGEQVLLTRNGKILRKGELLGEPQIREIFRDARKVETRFGRPVDLEWAMDASGKLFWLQARPVTALDRAHLNELDGTLFYEDEVFSRANIGEMMPGPVTPLTFSTFGRAIEVGLQDFYIASGALGAFSDEWIYFRMFYNHLFFSMTKMMEISGAVLMNKAENLEFAITGETLGSIFGDYGHVTMKPFLTRLWNQFRQLAYLTRGRKRAGILEQLAHTFSISDTRDPRELYGELDRGLEVLNSAYAHHYCASSQSGTYQTTLMSVLVGGNGKPETQHYRDAALLMSDLRELESADVVRSIDRLCEKYREDRDISRWLAGGEQDRETPAVAAFIREIDALLQKHGHRCIREGELREKSWEEDPGSLYGLIRNRFRAGGTGERSRGTYGEHRKEILSGLGGFRKLVLSLVLPPARAAVARREFTKSMAVKVQQKIKKAYLALAALMVEAGLLDDADQVFFLTHEELGRVLQEDQSGWKELAEERRHRFPEYFKLRFVDHCQGYPEPVPEHDPGIKINGNAVKGLPVSAGKVEARVRIIAKLEDAVALEKGEIMVCRYTDVGWTPYFSLASGLVTEIGSPLSHGAVVAREYGIPAVVNAKGATGFFRTGETVVLDGAAGVVRKTS